MSCKKPRIDRALRFAATMALLPATVPAATLRVPVDYPTIQKGLDVAAFGDTVLVAPGIYTDSEVRFEGGFPVISCAYMTDGVVLRSEDGSAHTTIDMLGASGGGPAAVVRARELSSPGTSVEGFTITGAPAGYRGAYVAQVSHVTFRDCVFRDLDAGASSGAGLAANGDVDVVDCEFVNCRADHGGGLYHSNGHLNLIRSRFSQCGSRGALLDGVLGGPGESAVVEECEFVDNWSDAGGGGMVVYAYNLGATIRNCRFEGNTSYEYGGGGLSVKGSGAKLVENCLFIANATTGVGQGGGLSALGSGSCIVRGNTFYANSNTYVLGGASLYGAGLTLQLDNNLVTGSVGESAIFVWTDVSLTTSCNVYWDNPTGVGIPLSPTDREIDPLYCDPESGDFTVQENSPCVEPGALGCGQIGAFPAGCGIVSVESSPWSQIKDLYRRGETP
ncbi:MAG: right-handed parallel beta-helix repeat-containing protein [bacterium]